MKKIQLYNAVIFLAAFLLFQIELIISKIFVPHFGGSYLVWGACVVFFQAVLLAGYLYSHRVVKALGIWRYRPWHIVLYVLPLFVFPGRPLPPIVSHESVPMVLDVFMQLAGSIGLVFFALSSAAIIIQSWLSASELPERSHPYALYAVSNLGSFAALLSYPFFFERYFDLDVQLAFWRLGYLALVALQVVLYLAVRKDAAAQDLPVTPAAAGASADEAPVKPSEMIRWMLWSAAGVIMFLSVTNIITYEITPAPLFWIIPLCLYLLSFVLIFKKQPWYPRWISIKFHLITAFSMMLYFIALRKMIPVVMQVAGFGVPLFLTCMFCQYNLLKRRPGNHAGLTSFYVAIAAGGFFGGILTTWVVPVATVGTAEYFLPFLLIYMALMLEQPRGPVGYPMFRHITYLLLTVLLWPVAFQGYNVFGIMLLVGVFYLSYCYLRANPHAVFMSVLTLLFVAPFLEPLWALQRYVHYGRNYYGIYKVYDTRTVRSLSNGTTLHGSQMLDPAKKREMLSYYHEKTPIYEVMTSPAFPRANVCAIGLGTGTLAALAEEGTRMDFYELDPEVYRIADTYFTFLKDSRARLEFIFGDARLNLRRAEGRRYDLIVVDAFSGDSVPVHLLTTEAIEEYRSRLTPGGTILFHISNRYLYLGPVLFSNARSVGAFAGVKTNDRVDLYKSASMWVAMTWDPAVFKELNAGLNWQTTYKGREMKKLRPWTDAYSSILPVIRTTSLFGDLKEFRPFAW